MSEIFAQGDILFERVADVRILDGAGPGDGPVVLAEGEVTGHRHQIYESVAFFRDDALARDIPDRLYIGHLRVGPDGASVQHDEHGAIDLTEGTWRVRRQRQLEPTDVEVIAD